MGSVDKEFAVEFSRNLLMEHRKKYQPTNSSLAHEDNMTLGRCAQNSLKFYPKSEILSGCQKKAGNHSAKDISHPQSMGGWFKPVLILIHHTLKKEATHVDS